MADREIAPDRNMKESREGDKYTKWIKESKTGARDKCMQEGK
jgi:hypothetical protein